MGETDEQLVAYCRQELPYVTTAFERLLRRYEPLVLGTCRRYLGNDQEGEEACQDVFLRAFHALPRFEGQAAFRTWLFRIAANVCATRYAKSKRQSEQLRQYRQEKASELRQELRHADDAPADLAEVLSAALDVVSDEEREVLVLRHVGGLSFEALASTLGIGVSAAKMRVYRAGQRVRAAADTQRKSGAQRQFA